MPCPQVEAVVSLASLARPAAKKIKIALCIRGVVLMIADAGICDVLQFAAAPVIGPCLLVGVEGAIFILAVTEDQDRRWF